MKLTDNEIIVLMSQSQTSEKGLRAMMDIYQSRLYWHIRRLIVQHDVAQDVLQDTFIKAYQNFAQFKNDSKLYTWLYRIATNEALQQLAKMKKMQKADEDTEQQLKKLVADNVEHDAEEIQILFEENTSRLCLGVREEKFEKRMVFHKTKNNLSSFEYLEALPRGLFILINSLNAFSIKSLVCGIFLY